MTTVTKNDLRVINGQVHRFLQMGMMQCRSCGRQTFSGSCGCPNASPELIDPGAGYWVPAPEEDWTKGRN